MNPPQMHWLPVLEDWSAQLQSVDLSAADPWRPLVRLANSRMDFVRTAKLDRTCSRLAATTPANPQHGLVRLAVLASSTVEHLLPAIRMGALRRGLGLQIYVCPYGQYRHELLDPASGLHQFRPDATLFALDAHHIVGLSAATGGGAADSRLDQAMDDLRLLWRQARESLQCQVIQQTVLPVLPTLLGSNEQRLPASGHRIVQLANERLRASADLESVDLLAIDARAALDGVWAWHDPVLWHRAKQEIHPAAAPVYGDLVGRLLAAQRGRSFKCLVLDLDNTLWGGVIGDDGLEGIALGQGSALGEAYVAFQHYVQGLARRGVILAVCSKNDAARALEPFDKHPEMVLRRSDIACFVANWDDKPANLRAIASRLNIGIDALAFADDNPFERNVVRRELADVGVPELPEDPSLYSYCIADGGYFEALRVTAEDTGRTRLYRENAERAALQSSTTDLAGYLRSLDMRLVWNRVDRTSLARVHQLINKTNQFNLTTRRYSEAEVNALLDDPDAIALQLRLLDRFGDNGIIAVVIARRTSDSPGAARIDTWLMSCRVLGRQVEEATLNVLAGEAQNAGVRELLGDYRPTAKNSMVSGHYPKLGFQTVDDCGSDSQAQQWVLPLERFQPFETFIAVARAG